VTRAYFALKEYFSGRAALCRCGGTLTREGKPQVKIVDLTQAMANGMPVMAGITPPEFRDLADVATDGYAMSQYTFINHTGTHVDAPAHQIAGGTCLDDIPLDRLVTEAVTIDLTGHDPGPVCPADLDSVLDQVRPGDIVLLRSDNAENWGTDAYWNGWCYPDAAASRALIARGVSGVGFDGPSADPVDSVDFELHQMWLGAGKIIIENLTGLAELPARCRIVVAPLKVRGANGGPARVLAFVDD
jgi:arylformamidase